jgi:hypothetical protein
MQNLLLRLKVASGRVQFGLQIILAIIVGCVQFDRAVLWDILVQCALASLSLKYRLFGNHPQAHDPSLSHASLSTNLAPIMRCLDEHQYVSELYVHGSSGLLVIAIGQVILDFAQPVYCFFASCKTRQFRKN